MAAFTDERMELSISRMLQIGVSLSALIVLCGGLLYLGHSGGALPVYSVFKPERGSLRSVADTLHGTARFDPQSIIQLGMLVLIATPVLRVAFCVAGFLRQHDRLYTAVSAFVLLILLYSFFQGGR